MGSGRGRLAGDVRRNVHGGRRATCHAPACDTWQPSRFRPHAASQHRTEPIPACSTAGTTPFVLASPSSHSRPRPPPSHKRDHHQEWLNAALPPTHAPHPDLSLLWTYRHVYDTYRDREGERQGEGHGDGGADTQGQAATRREVLQEQQQGGLLQQQQQQGQVSERSTGAAVQGEGHRQHVGKVQGRAGGDQRVGCQGGWSGWLLRALRLSALGGRGRGKGAGCQGSDWVHGGEVAGQGQGQGQQQQQEGRRRRRLSEDQGVALEAGGQGSGVGEAMAVGGAEGRGGVGSGAGQQQRREELGGGQGGRVGEEGGKERNSSETLPSPPPSPPGPPQHRFVNGAVPGGQAGEGKGNGVVA